MPNPVWPVALPQRVLKDGYVEQTPENSIESTMDAGAPKSRRRFTANYVSFQVTIACSAAQADDFDTFFQTTLKDGNLAFDWVHPRKQTLATFRFRLPPPQKTPRGGGNMDIQFNLWMIP